MSTVKYDPSVLSQNGLVCPYWIANPSNPQHTKFCFSKGKGWPSLGRLMCVLFCLPPVTSARADYYCLVHREHVKRIHTPKFYCDECGIRLKGDKTTLALTSQNLEEHKRKHCKGAKVVDRATVMSPAQQQRLDDEVTKTRKALPKLEKLYEVCGVQEPVTYRASLSLSLPSLPSLTQRADPTATDLHPLQQPLSPLPDAAQPPNMFAGFQRPVVQSEDPPPQIFAQPLRRATLHKLDHDFQSTGSAARPLKDSGYGSWTQEEGPKVAELRQPSPPAYTVTDGLLGMAELGREVPPSMNSSADLDIDADGETDEDVLDESWYERSMRRDTST